VAHNRVVLVHGHGGIDISDMVMGWESIVVGHGGFGRVHGTILEDLSWWLSTPRTQRSW